MTPYNPYTIGSKWIYNSDGTGCWWSAALVTVVEPTGRQTLNEHLLHERPGEYICVRFDNRPAVNYAVACTLLAPTPI
jgi:hypothetical protein